MNRSPARERAYLIQRAADHRRQADNTPDEKHQSLHRRFASLYEERAAALEVQEH